MPPCSIDVIDEPSLSIRVLFEPWEVDGRPSNLAFYIRCRNHARDSRAVVEACFAALVASRIEALPRRVPSISLVRILSSGSHLAAELIAQTRSALEQALESALDMSIETSPPGGIPIDLSAPRCPNPLVVLAAGPRPPRDEALMEKMLQDLVERSRIACRWASKTRNGPGSNYAKYPQYLEVRVLGTLLYEAGGWEALQAGVRRVRQELSRHSSPTFLLNVAWEGIGGWQY